MSRLLQWWRDARAARNTAALEARWVVADCETSGLDPATDRVLSIGAVAVRGACVVLEDSFTVLLRQERASAPANILVHGIGGAAQREGLAAHEAMRGFIAYAGPDPLVGFHAAFDRAVLARGAREAAGVSWSRPWLDLAALLPVLFPAQARGCRSLDDWLAAFSIAHPSRHEALGDAYATAQLFLVALAEAGRRGARSVRDLLQAERAGRWTGA